ncbi:response regulator [Rubinisphaera margarita]|uniref:response regulator n=1 Tax=Rubinisphaera margarita TaxID=2909586 RepID=UPI001EE92DB7|nr:response regulator [Rubinisphaera margarita]MCG6155839.1 response regulator [Rubinisphaera margarita]
MDKTAILIAEDNRVMADVVRFNLQRAGFEVTVALDGAAALEQARSRQFDLVITDYQMPRMGGPELIAALRGMEEYADIPIFLCSAKGYELNEAELREQWGIQRLLLKPFSPTEIVACVEQQLRAEQT